MAIRIEVEPNRSLQQVAEEHGVDVNQIAAYNRLNRKDAVNGMFETGGPGTTLWVPNSADDFANLDAAKSYAQGISGQGNDPGYEPHPVMYQQLANPDWHAPPVLRDGRPLVQGDQGADVFVLQNFLVKSGYMDSKDAQKAPGLFGPNTEHALSWYQRANGIDAGDGAELGIFGNKTLSVMRSQLGDQPDDGGQIEAPLFAQSDPRWGADPYVFNGGTNISVVGCTLSSMAMAASWAANDPAITPGQVNASSQNYFSAMNRFDTVHLGDQVGHPLRWINEQGPQFSPIAKDSAEAAQLLDAVRDSIRNDRPVLLGMNVAFNGWTRHTVLATGVSPDGDILFNDPAGGKITSLSAYQQKPGFTGFDMADSVVRR